MLVSAIEFALPRPVVTSVNQGSPTSVEVIDEDNRFKHRFVTIHAEHAECFLELLDHGLLGVVAEFGRK